MPKPNASAQKGLFIKSRFKIFEITVACLSIPGNTGVMGVASVSAMPRPVEPMSTILSLKAAGSILSLRTS